MAQGYQVGSSGNTHLPTQVSATCLSSRHWMSTTTRHSLPGAWRQDSIMTAVPGAQVVMAAVAIAIDTTVVITVGTEILAADVY